MRAINLLPRDAVARKSFKDEDPAVVIGSALGAVVILALAATFMNVHGKVGHEQSKLDAARQQLAQLSNRHDETPKRSTKPVKQVTIVPVPAVTQEEQPRLDALTSAMSQRISWDRVLREFSQVLPSDVSITTLQLSAPDASAAGVTTGASTGLTVSGSAYSHDGVARFLSRLALIPDLDDVTLANSNAGGGNVQFSITAAIKGAVAPVTTPPAAVTTPATTDTTTTTSDGSSS
jgi:Tfp pilus assembly protein PilN